MTELEKDIESLLNSQAFTNLGSLTPSFSLFETLGIKHRELSHSKTLAWLFSERCNAPFRSGFLKWLKTKPRSPRFDQIQEKPNVRVEYGDSEAGRIDVFLEFKEAKLVIAIENKIHAYESEGQIERYQNFLKRHYKSHDKIVIFLSPTGYAPTSGQLDRDVPIICMSWRNVASLISNSEPTGFSAIDGFSDQFATHIRKDIVMTETEEQKTIRRLLQNKKHARTFQTIMNNLPSLGRFESKWKKLLLQNLVSVESASELEVKPYSTKGVYKELKVKVSRWCNAGLPFTIMLFEYENAGIRVMLNSGDLDEHKETLKEFALANIDLINIDYPSVDDWYTWHAVMKEDGTQEEPEHTLIHGTLVDEDWEQLVAERLSDQVPKLAAAVNKWINEHRSILQPEKKT
jgi:hypothetical protein